MAGKPRVEFKGATYHMMYRGNHQETVFKDAKDQECFLDTRGEVSERNGWLIHAFVLMGNHYHLLRVEWITQRLKMGVPSNFSRYIRAVEESKEGLLWELKNKMTI